MPGTARFIVVPRCSVCCAPQLFRGCRYKRTALVVTAGLPGCLFPGCTAADVICKWHGQILACTYRPVIHIWRKTYAASKTQL